MGSNIRQLACQTEEKTLSTVHGTWLRFVSLWIATLKVWASSPKRIPMAENEKKLFIEALEKLMNDAVLLHPHIKATPPPPRPSKSQQETARQMRKRKRAVVLEGIFETLKAEK